MTTSSSACEEPAAAYVSEYVSIYVSIRQHIRQHTSAYVSIRQHTSAHVSTRQQTAAEVRVPLHGCCLNSNGPRQKLLAGKADVHPQQPALEFARNFPHRNHIHIYYGLYACLRSSGVSVCTFVRIAPKPETLKPKVKSK